MSAQPRINIPLSPDSLEAESDRKQLKPRGVDFRHVASASEI